jgi:alpha-beta hydrolase superfamily lysophospholipase
MEHWESEFKGERGTRIWFQAWQPQAPRATVAVAHGLGEHSGRYRNVVDTLVPRGYAIYALDHRGHGRSAGRRGHADRFADYVGDLGRLIGEAQRAQPGLPTFLLGHSMGGAIALAYALERPEGLSGVIVSSPWLQLKLTPPANKLALARVMSRILPTFTQRSGLPVNGLSHDPQVALDYVADRLVHDRISARLFVEIVGAQERILADAESLRLPCLFLLPGADPIVDSEATRQYFGQVGSTDKTLHVYEGLYHEGFNELGKEQPLGDLADWLDARLPA